MCPGKSRGGEVRRGGHSTSVLHGAVQGIRARLRCVLVLFLFYAPFALSQEDPPSSIVAPFHDATRRVALVVGKANYRSLVRLENAANDGQDICAALSRLQFETSCHTDVPRRKEFREVVRRFASSLAPKTAAFFYYAGHGVQINGENYLLPTDIDPRSAADLEDEGLSLSYLLRLLEEARSAPSIIVLDACRDNPFGSTGRSSLPSLKVWRASIRPLVPCWSTRLLPTALPSMGKDGTDCLPSTCLPT